VAVKKERESRRNKKSFSRQICPNWRCRNGVVGRVHFATRPLSQKFDSRDSSIIECGGGGGGGGRCMEEELRANLPPPPCSEVSSLHLSAELPDAIKTNMSHAFASVLDGKNRRYVLTISPGLTLASLCSNFLTKLSVYLQK
jgi:hypothetical protein